VCGGPESEAKTNHNSMGGKGKDVLLVGGEVSRLNHVSREPLNDIPDDKPASEGGPAPPASGRRVANISGEVQGDDNGEERHGDRGFKHKKGHNDNTEPDEEGVAAQGEDKDDPDKPQHLRRGGPGKGFRQVSPAPK